jgi:hypothetical protein
MSGSILERVSVDLASHTIHAMARCVEGWMVTCQKAARA